MFGYSEPYIPCELYPIGSVLEALEMKPAKPSQGNYPNMPSTQFYAHHPSSDSHNKNCKTGKYGKESFIDISQNYKWQFYHSQELTYKFKHFGSSNNEHFNNFRVSVS